MISDVAFYVLCSSTVLLGLIAIAANLKANTLLIRVERLEARQPHDAACACCNDNPTAPIENLAHSEYALFTHEHDSDFNGDGVVDDDEYDIGLEIRHSSRHARTVNGNGVPIARGRHAKLED